MSCKAVGNLIDKKFGNLLVTSFAGRDLSMRRNPIWICLCDCGNEKTVRGDNLKSGNTTSCGKDTCHSHYKHGHNTSKGKSPEYTTWDRMIGRCNNVKDDNYKNYGGRGIKVCERWLCFENFLEDMKIRPKGKTLDRIDNNGNYELDNCKWSTQKEQMNNIRNNVKITYKNVTKTINQWSEEINLSVHCIRRRLELGWDIDKIMNTPVLTQYQETKK